MDQVQEELRKQSDTLAADLVATFCTAHGGRILEHLKSSFFGRDPMYAPGVDALTLAFREGQRSVILTLEHSVMAALYPPEEQQTHYAEHTPPEEEDGQWQTL